MNRGLLILIFFLTGCAVSKNPLRKEVKRLQRGIVHDDTSFVYALPYEVGRKHLIIQGYFGIFSHKERAALDFKMNRGTTVTSARKGVVVRVKQDSDRGGWSKKYRTAGNNVVIQHADGSRAGYWHIQHNGALVKVGDSVKMGQPIALSGKTGYAATPHLHFIVWKFGTQGNWQQVATRFQTSRGIKYLRAWHSYKSVASGR
jgi:murein DD-endopeptidase MepM/ murein hydrolase activator NlpD